MNTPSIAPSIPGLIADLHALADRAETVVADCRARIAEMPNDQLCDTLYLGRMATESLRLREFREVAATVQHGWDRGMALKSIRTIHDRILHQALHGKFEGDPGAADIAKELVSRLEDFLND